MDHVPKSQAGPGLFDELIGAERLCLGAVIVPFGGRTNHDWKLTMHWVEADPFQHLEAVDLGEIQIEQDYGRQGVTFTVGKAPLGGQ